MNGGERRGLIVPAAAIAVLLAFLPVLGHGWVYDDHRFVAANGALDGIAGAPWRAFDPAVTTVDGAEPGMWRPLRTLSFALDRGLFGSDPAGAHLHSALLHGAAAATVAALGLRLGLGAGAAFVAGLLFGLHPLQVEPVAWVAARGDLLCGLLLLVAVAIHLGGRPLAAAGVCGAAFLAKESAIVAPLLLVTADLAAGGWERVRTARRGPQAAAAIVAGLVGVRLAVLGAGPAFSQGEGLGLGPGVLALAQPAMLGHYFLRTVVPLPGAFDLQLDPTSPWPALAAAGAVGLLLAAARVPALRSTAAPARLAAAWSVGVLLPVTLLQVAFPLKILVADRFAYLALAGPALAAGALLDRAGGRAVAVAAAGAPLLLFSTVPALGTWRDDTALWSAVLARDPGHPRALHGMAAAQQREGRLQDADRYYRAYLAEAPGDAGAWLQAGLVEEALAERAAAAPAEGGPEERGRRLLGASASFHTAILLWLGGDPAGRERGLPAARLARACVLASLGQGDAAEDEALEGLTLWRRLPRDLRVPLEGRRAALGRWAAGTDRGGVLVALDSPPERP